MRLIKKCFSTSLIITLIAIYSCNKDDTSSFIPITDIGPISTSVKDTLLYFQSYYDGVYIPMKVSFPTDAQLPLPAVVVLHGSGGGWKDKDTNGDDIADIVYVDELSSQNREWAELLNQNGYIAVFPESYYARGTIEAKGKWNELPLKLKISEQGPRSRDAVQALETILKLKDESGKNWVQESNVGILGFSAGGTAAYSAIYDHPNATPEGFEWFFDGDIPYPEPLNTNEHPKFAAAVIKYGTGAHHQYYGIVSDCQKNIYVPYCPVRVELAENDNLTENSLKLISCMKEKRVPNLTYQMYNRASHGYDTDNTTGPIARQHTLRYFDRYLKN